MRVERSWDAWAIVLEGEFELLFLLRNRERDVSFRSAVCKCIERVVEEGLEYDADIVRIGSDYALEPVPRDEDPLLFESSVAALEDGIDDALQLNQGELWRGAERQRSERAHLSFELVYLGAGALEKLQLISGTRRFALFENFVE